MAPAARARGSLVKQVSNNLRSQIVAGHFQIGDKLPSQSLLAANFVVSRTVVREAIASLQADGLVESHQGAGVFVIAQASPSPLPFHAIDHARISSLLEMLELRTAVEIEAAALAAQRRSPAQEEAIFRAHQGFAALIAKKEPSTAADFAFHRAIAEATNNPRFPEFLDLLGLSAIPRAALKAEGAEAVRTTYLDKIVEEHRQIAQAISAGDELAAREAMRAHLRGSQRRYRSLIQDGMS
ncbi:MAG TPA: FadR/GntR family transcriptional regulator [Devosiaceae bacterium]|nr:FadR/GntR family transcriptional regulator [Devosiaceae bacterium]